MKKSCLICNKEFKTNTNCQKLCSKFCIKMYRRIYAKYYNELHKNYIKKLRKKYLSKHKVKIAKQQKKRNIKYYWLHKKEHNKNSHKYYIQNKKRLLKQQREYNRKHKKIQKEYILKYMKIRRKKDINFKIKSYLRTRIWEALKGINKSNKTIKLIGCSIEFLKKHLEKQFTEGMSWKNYGAGNNGKGMKEWHIDHIKRCSEFDLIKEKEQLKCFNYKNLQPLWAKDNRTKHCILSRKRGSYAIYM